MQTDLRRFDIDTSTYEVTNTNGMKSCGIFSKVKWDIEIAECGAASSLCRYLITLIRIDHRFSPDTIKRYPSPTLKLIIIAMFFQYRPNRRGKSVYLLLTFTFTRYS